MVMTTHTPGADNRDVAAFRNAVVPGSATRRRRPRGPVDKRRCLQRGLDLRVVLFTIDISLHFAFFVQAK
jgi:hypothetical protein